MLATLADIGYPKSWPAEKRNYTVVGKRGNRERVDWGRAARHRANEWVTVDALAVLCAAGRLQA